MSNVKDLIGFEYEPYTFEIEKGKIREFAEAIEADNSIFFDLEAARESGYENIPIPLTFFTSIDFWGGPSFEEKVEKLNLNPLKLLHGEQGYEYIKPIYAGDVLTVTPKITNVEVKEGASGGMDIITTISEYVNQNGELVAKAKLVTIQRH